MKIAVIGYSGSGKSTLARTLGERCGAPVLHLDTVQWCPGWRVRDKGEQQRIVEDFLNANASWVIDGNYTGLSYARRLEEADRIVELLFPPLVCLARVLRRLRRWRGRTRPDMGEGCTEKVDLPFVRWVLRDGRTRSARERYAAVARQYADKTVILRSQRALDRFLREETI